MASSKIERRFAALEERVAALETIIESAMADGGDGGETPAPTGDGGSPNDEPTKP